MATADVHVDAGGGQSNLAVKGSAWDAGGSFGRPESPFKPNGTGQLRPDRANPGARRQEIAFDNVVDVYFSIGRN